MAHAIAPIGRLFALAAIVLPRLAEPVAAAPFAVDIDVQRWIADAYRWAPALVLGLAVLILLPLLAFTGALMGWARPEPDRTILVGREGAATAARDDDGADTGGGWPASAWIEIPELGATHEVGRGMVRLGRDEENEICLPDKTVHRYHAVIHRTEDAEFKITDLSSSDGNGVIVNGQRIAEARLRHGDTVQLGQAVLTFHERPA